MSLNTMSKRTKTNASKLKAENNSKETSPTEEVEETAVVTKSKSKNVVEKPAKKVKKDNVDALDVTSPVPNKTKTAKSKAPTSKTDTDDKPSNAVLYKKFLVKEMARQRALNPNLNNKEYMKLVSKPWADYKEKHGIITGKTNRKKTIISVEQTTSTDD